MKQVGTMQSGIVSGVAGKYLKPYQGLKLQLHQWQQDLMSCRKIPKTLSGIETIEQQLQGEFSIAGKYLKPYQGLKRE